MFQILGGLRAPGARDAILWFESEQSGSVSQSQRRFVLRLGKILQVRDDLFFHPFCQSMSENHPTVSSVSTRSTMHVSGGSWYPSNKMYSSSSTYSLRRPIEPGDRVDSYSRFAYFNPDFTDYVSTNGRFIGLICYSSRHFIAFQRKSFPSSALSSGVIFVAVPAAAKRAHIGIGSPRGRGGLTNSDSGMMTLTFHQNTPCCVLQDSSYCLENPVAEYT